MPVISSGCQSLPVISSGYSMVVSDMLMVSNDCQWLPVMSCNCQWLPVISSACQWLPVIASDLQQWLPAIVNGCQLTGKCRLESPAWRQRDGSGRLAWDYVRPDLNSSRGEGVSSIPASQPTMEAPVPKLFCQGCSNPPWLYETCFVVLPWVRARSRGEIGGEDSEVPHQVGFIVWMGVD